MNVKDIKKEIKAKRLALVLGIIAVLSACNNDPVVPIVPGMEKGDSNIQLRIYVPKGSISSYAPTQDATKDENRIDTLIISLYDGISKAFIRTDSIDWSKLAYENNHNDSIVTVGYAIEGVSATTLIAKVYANRQHSKIITNEIVFPTSTRRDETAFLMTDSTTLTKVAPDAQGRTGFVGEVHLVRDVAKLRIDISKAAETYPADLTVDYDGIKIEVVKTPDRTAPWSKRGEPATLNYIAYTERSGTNLRRASTFSTTNGGQIDSLYLYENRRSSYTPGTNTTQLKITIPTKSVTDGDKTASYIYTLETDYSKTGIADVEGYDVLRNYIYTLKVTVRAQSLDPLFSLDLQPWNDVSIPVDIGGTYLTVQTSEIEFDEITGYAEVGFCTDAQAIYVNYKDFKTGAMQIGYGKDIEPINILPANQALSGNDYEGQVLLDKKNCNYFGFQLASDKLSERENLSGNICIKAGNIVKCLAFVGKKTYDAHYIVGEEFVPEREKCKKAVVTSGSPWLEVSPDILYTNKAQSTYNDKDTMLYLHLDENLTGADREGSIEVTTASGTVKTINVRQLAALPIGPFGFDANTATDNGNFTTNLYMEQLCEHDLKTVAAMPKYGGTASPSILNNTYNGWAVARDNAIFDASKYNNETFDWKSATYQAINYCAYKNRDKNKNGILDPSEREWHLPSQAQLMAMWVSYEPYKYLSTSNFPKNHQYFIKPDNTISNNIDYWSSTVSKRYPAEAQYMSFLFGNVGYFNRGRTSWTRCVRSTGPKESIVDLSHMEVELLFHKAMPPSSYTTSSKGNGVGSDTSAINATVFYQLRSQLFDDGRDKTWTEAVTICTGVGTRWRLPTQKELQAIWLLKDEVVTQVASTGFIGFSDFKEDYYWTATTSSAYPDNAYMVYMGNTPGVGMGNTPHIAKTHKASVRCLVEMP